MFFFIMMVGFKFLSISIYSGACFSTLMFETTNLFSMNIERTTGLETRVIYRKSDFGMQLTMTWVGLRRSRVQVQNRGPKQEKNHESWLTSKPRSFVTENYKGITFKSNQTIWGPQSNHHMSPTFDQNGPQSSIISPASVKFHTIWGPRSDHHTSHS